MNNARLGGHALVLSLLSLGLLACAPTEPNDPGPEPSVDAGPEDLSFEVPRVLLHEVFSGSNCGPCLEADDNIQRVLDDNPGEYTVIHYQVGSDPYMSAESVARRFFYLPPETGSYGIPYLHVDGVNGMHPNEVNDDQGYLQQNFDAFQAVPSHLKLAARHSIVGKSVDVSVEIEAGADYPSEQLTLFIAISEKTTTGNVGSNGQTEFHHVMKKMLPNDDGRPLPPLDVGDRLARNLSYTFQGDYNGETSRQNQVNHAIEHTVEEFDDLEVLVWVQNIGTLEVYQSAWSVED